MKDISYKAKYKQKIEPDYNNEIKVQKIKRVLIQTKRHFNILLNQIAQLKT
jgi:MarR-like DNA-binding transcriptional regulator SgrR of sgrS sRNA